MRPTSFSLFLLRLAVPVLTVAAAAVLLLAEPSWLPALRHAVFDQYQRLQPRPYQEAPVLVVDVDEASLQRLGQWPWPRTRLAELAQRLQQAGAAAIGFDVVFAEADRTSPRAAEALWPPSPALHEALARLPDHDEAFAAALRPGGVVLGLALERAASGAAAGTTALASSPSATPPDLPARFVLMGEQPLAGVHRFDRAVPPLPVLASAAAGLGALTFVPDNDGIVRRVPLLLRVGDQPVPSLAAELLRVGQGAGNHVVRAVAEGGAVAEVRIGALAVPTTAAGEAWVHFGRPAAERSVPAWEVLDGQVLSRQMEQRLQGRIVLVGSSAQGLLDLRFSPLGGAIPGVEVHAQWLEQALTDGFLQRPAWAPAAEALALVACGLVVGSLAVLARALVSAAVALAVVAGLAAAGWLAFSGHRLLLDPVTPALGVLLAFVLPSVLGHYASERRQRWVKQAFSRYVSPNLVTHLVEHPEQLALGGQRRFCSFVFTDLADFTGLLEKMDPAGAVGLLNAYLDEMIAIAFRHQGTLDRIVGDAVAIMFSAPVPQEDHRERAWRCALEMRRFAERYVGELAARGTAFGHTRIGVHSGEVIVGNFGGSTIFDYRALGDPVNTAARLESVNKQLGTRMCVSAATLAGCPGAEVRRVGRLVLKGKSEPLQVFQPLDDGLREGVSTLAPVADYEAAYEALASDPPAAAQAFAALAARWPEDPLVRLHLQRLRAGEAGDVIVMTAK